MNTKRRGRKPRQVANIAAQVENNPFVIEEGITLAGNRGSTAFTAQLLVEQVKKLPLDKNVSIAIPKAIADTANAATNLVLAVRRFLKNDKHVPKSFAITVRIFKDHAGNYVNSRIWRIN